MADLKDISKSLTKTIAEEMDKRIIDFFGSEADVRQFAHLYVLEEIPMTLETCYQPNLTGDYFAVRAESRWRIRPKTLEEMEADRRD